MTSLSRTLIASSILALAGCGDTTTNTGGDGGGMQATGMPRTLTYVINRITVDQGAGGNAPNPAMHTSGVAGFDLDGRKTGPMAGMPVDCAHGDFFSTTDPDQNMGTCAAGMARGGAGCNGGVDNQLPEIAQTVGGFGTDIRMTLTEQVNTGRVAIMVRVLDVNGDPGPSLNDSSVTVKVYPVTRPMFANCMQINTPGNRYAIDTASLRMGSTNIEDALITFQGSIVNGRLRVTPPAAGGSPNFTFNLPISNMTIPLNLYQTQLRVTMGADTGTDGNLGGYVPLRDLTTMLASLLPAGIPPATVQTVLMSLVDIQLPMGNAMGCTAPNGGISLGLGFTTVRAEAAAMPVTGAQMGMCGR